MAQEMTASKAARVAAFLAGALLLVCTWHLARAWLAVRIEGLLVPWDMWGNLAPPPGTWQRWLNDWASAHHGHLAMAIVGGSVVLFLVGLARAKRRALLPLSFAVTSIVFLFCDILLANLSYRLPLLWLPEPRPKLDLGYHLTWPGIALLMGLLVFLYWAQAALPAVLDRLRLAPAGEGTA